MLSVRKPLMLAEIMKDLGLIFFASVFLGPVLGGSSEPRTLATGFLLSVLSLTSALVLARE